MTSRERFRKTLNHEEPDRVPIDFGQDYHNGINEVAYERLLRYLKIKDAGETKVYDLMQRLAVVDQRVLERFHVDTRYIFTNPNEYFEVPIEEDGSFEDEWGVYRKRVGYYCENVRAPLTGKSKEDIIKHKFPDPAENSRFKGLRERAKSLYETTDYALSAGQAATIFYFSSELTGFDEYMLDLALNPSRIEVLVEKVLEWMIEFTSRYLDEVGDYVETWWMGDDWGMQTGPIMSPETFRKTFKPCYKRLIDAVRSRTDAKVCLHTCGATYWILGDLADVGVDVVHPLQPTALGNEDPVKLKRDFGKEFVFYSNIANTTVLPHGKPGEVREEVKNKIKHLAPGGGYILSGGHNIQADVSAENVVALFDSAYEFGNYPITF
jgi:uroporphyrinogen decarboxylase